MQAISNLGMVEWIKKDVGSNGRESTVLVEILEGIQLLWRSYSDILVASRYGASTSGKSCRQIYQVIVGSFWELGIKYLFRFHTNSYLVKTSFFFLIFSIFLALYAHLIVVSLLYIMDRPCPSTPPRKTTAHCGNHITPKSIRQVAKTPAKSFQSPTPTRKLLKSPRKGKDELCRLEPPAPLLFPPTPLSASVRKVKSVDFVEPPIKSRNLSSQLRDIAEKTSEDDNKINGQLEFGSEFLSSTNSLGISLAPRTPSPKLEIAEPFLSSKVQKVTWAELEKIPRVELENPFVEHHSTEILKKEKPDFDPSTHVEFFNHRTGNRQVRELSESEKGFKPRKLQFSSPKEERMRSQLDRDREFLITNEYLEQAMGSKFAMPREKDREDFEIFSDI